MSKHWKPPSSSHRLSGRELTLVLLLGLCLGLLYLQVSANGWRWSRGSVAPEIDFAASPAPDPYREARRSREILRPQEQGPIPRVELDKSDRRRQRVGPADVVDVIDGDTFRFGGEKIRIADIDTPEVDGRCVYETQLAVQATQRLAVLLAQGPFTLEPVDRDEDRYGRKLRIVTRGGRSIGDQLVAEGLARTWTGRREPWCT